jgi:hypothetical protein
MPYHPNPLPLLLNSTALLLFLSGCAGSLPRSEARLNYLIAGGEPDLSDRYSSVVRIIVPERGSCSGVLVNAQLVLTAAHCLCMPAPGTLDADKVYSFTRAKAGDEVLLACSKAVSIVASLYAASEAASRREDGPKDDYTARLVEPRELVYDGPVRIVVHEGYKFRTNDDADIVDSRMDLAAIHLAGTFPGVRLDALLPDREVQPGESIVAVGYGPTEDQNAGKRHFGRTKATKPALSANTDEMFAFARPEVPLREVEALSGDSGGPCFREDPEGHRWLIGIISHSRVVDGRSVASFTSTFHHREWINRQKSLSAQTANALGKHTPKTRFP